jgi:hypothetical protein
MRAKLHVKDTTKTFQLEKLFVRFNYIIWNVNVDAVGTKKLL